VQEFEGKWSRRPIPCTPALSACTNLPPWLRRRPRTKGSLRHVTTPKIAPSTLSTALGKIPIKTVLPVMPLSDLEATSKCGACILSEQSLSDPRFELPLKQAHERQWHAENTEESDCDEDDKHSAISSGSKVFDKHEDDKESVASKHLDLEVSADVQEFEGKWSRRPIPCTPALSACTNLPPWLRRRPRTKGSLRHVTTPKIAPSTLSTALGKIPIKTVLPVMPLSDLEATSKCGACILSEQSLSEQPSIQSEVVGTDSYAAVVSSPQGGPSNSSLHAAVQNKTTTTSFRRAVPVVASFTSDVRQSKGHAVVVSEPINKRKYSGRVSWFRGSYGWVRCEEIAAKYSGLDAFLHINDCDFKPIQGNEVEFRLAMDDTGNPKAVQAQQARPHDVINARDWFALKQRR